MAVFNSFTFDGINSLDSGVYITGQAVFNAPERVVEMVTVPGRNGALALDQGRFENIEVTYHAGCFADSQADFADKVMRFRNALASRYTYKRLTDEYHPDEYRLGLYKSGLDVDAVRYGTAGEFNIVFDCKPQRFLIDGDRAISPTEWSDVQTESGELVTIDSDGSLAVKSLKVSLEPIQDLNGYSHPWVGGAGKNKLPATVENIKASNTGITWSGNVGTKNGVTFTLETDSSGNLIDIKLNGTATANIQFLLDKDAVYNGNYIVNGGISNSIRVAIYGKGGSVGGDLAFTGDETALFSWIYVANGTVCSNNIVKPMVRLATETDATYEPYTNICPISGRTEVVTHRVGKNFIPYPYRDMSKTVNGITSVVNDDGSVVLNGTATANVFLNFCLEQNKVQFEKGSYVLSSGTTLPSGVKIYANVRVGSSNLYSVSVDSNHEATMNAQQSGFLRCYISITSGTTVSNLTIKPMIRLASDTDDTYEPYNGYTYIPTLQRTVYGGTLDVVSGVLTVDRAILTLNGSETWTNSNGTATACMRVETITNVGFKPNASNTSLVGDISSAFVEVTPNQTWSGTIGFSVSADANPHLHFCQTGQKNMSVEAWKTYLASNPIQVVGYLATPQTYQLTPQQVTLLVGENHLFSDGEIMVEYGTHPYYNPTQFESRPLLVVTGKGILQIGDYVLTIVGRENQTIYIDCESQEAWEVVGAGKISRNDYIRNAGEEFPVLVPGINNISLGSGITAVTITPRWWRI